MAGHGEFVDAVFWWRKRATDSQFRGMLADRREGEKAKDLLSGEADIVEDHVRRMSAIEAAEVRDAARMLAASCARAHDFRIGGTGE